MQSTTVTVIVVARNEEKNIASCLQDIIRQAFDKKLLEIIVVDDNSTDSTYEIVKKISINTPCLSILKSDALADCKAFKKHAITQAIKQSKGELIVTTDADCNMNPEWLSTIVDFYETYQPPMIVAPVCIQASNNIFEKFQAIEFAGLTLVTAATTFLKKPVMCNGANLAYMRTAFEKVNGFEGIDTIASGDDVLLMNKINKAFPQQIMFLKNVEAIVFTKAVSSFTAFFNQRVRWAAKARVSGSIYNSFLAVLVYVFNFSALAGLIVLLFHTTNTLFIPFLVSAFIINFLLLFLGLSFLGVKKYGWLIIIEQPLYLLYVLLIGCVGLLKKQYTWKGRRIV